MHLKRTVCGRSYVLTVLRWLQIGSAVCFLLFSVFFFVPGVSAQNLNLDRNNQAVEKIQSSASVEIDGYVLFAVRGSTPEQAVQRANTIASRIIALARDETFSIESLRVFDHRVQTKILNGKDTVMVVFDTDARAEDKPRMVLAGAFKERMARAIEDYRTERTREFLLAKAWHAGGASLALIVVLVLLAWFFRRLHNFLERRYKARMTNMEVHSFHILETEELWAALRGAIGVIHVLGVLALLVSYLHYVLGLYPWTRPSSLYFLDLILKPLETIGTATLDSLPNLIFILILVLIVRYLLKMTRLFFGGVALGKVKLAGFEREWALPTYKIIRLFAIAFAVVVAYPYIPGSDSAAFKGVSIFVGIVNAHIQQLKSLQNKVSFLTGWCF